MKAATETGTGNSKSHLQFGKLKFVIEMRHGLLEPQNANAYLMCAMHVA